MHLFFNGKIHAFSDAVVVDWLLCAGGKIISSGKKSNRPQLPDFAGQTDLEGKTVLPAFTDAHTHFVATALGLQRIQLDQARSLEDAVHILKKESARFKPGEWVRGGGFNKNLWQDGQPHQSILDAIFPYNPVALESKDFHAMWLNSKGMKKAGIHLDMADPRGGRIERDLKGNPTGILYEKALDQVYKNIALPEQKSIAQSVKKISRQFLSLGITSVHTMEGLAEFKALQLMDQAEILDLRVTFFIPKDEAKALVSAGILSGFGSDMLRIAGVKIFTDGSLGSQTAHMLEPYNGTANTGIPHISAEDLKKEVSYFNQNGLSATVHAIGDAAVIKTLDAFAFAQEQISNTLIFNRMEHAQLVPTAQIERFKELNITASMQPVHIADDMQLAEQLWGSRCMQAYPIYDLQQSGVNLAFGSDMPVAAFNPFHGIYSAMERKYALDPAREKWVPEQAIDLTNALKAYTIGPAKSINQDKKTGTLQAGKAADFIVIDRDIFKLPPEELLQTRVLQTALNGHLVYQV